MSDMLKIALPKGRLGEVVYDMFAKAGFPCPEVLEKSRKLMFENTQAGVCYFWVKPSDVAIYVERGAADIGVVGKDVLMEYTPDLLELLDLGVGACRLAVAGKKGVGDRTTHTLRVATKFPHVTRAYYAARGRDIDIIKLNGSIELAPLLGLSDVIVDIVETGKTLLENGLEPFETVAPVSARLVANRSAYQFKTDAIVRVLQSLREQVV